MARRDEESGPVVGIGIRAAVWSLAEPQRPLGRSGEVIDTPEHQLVERLGAAPGIATMRDIVEKVADIPLQLRRIQRRDELRLMPGGGDRDAQRWGP